MTARPLPPVALLRELFSYDPLTGAITYRRQLGPRGAGEAAGTTHQNRPLIFASGRYHDAAAVAWALLHGTDPAPKFVVPVDQDRQNLRADNLALSYIRFSTPRHLGKRRRPKKTPGINVRYSRTEGCWYGRYGRKFVGRYDSRKEAIDAVNIRMEEEMLGIEAGLTGEDICDA